MNRPFPAFHAVDCELSRTSLDRSRYNLIPLLLDLAKQAIKEKILRVVVSTFRNLITRAPKQNLAPMLVAKVLPWIQQSMQGRMFSDDEIKEDVDFLANELKSSFDGMT